MKKKKVVKLALMGLTIGAMVSGCSSDSQNGKNGSNCNNKSNCNGKTEKSNCNGKSGCSNKGN